MGIFSTINSFITAHKQKKEARKINPVNTTYDTNPAISNLYSEGKNLYQGRMAGAGAAEQNLLNANANYGAAVDSNATSGSQAIAAKAAALGQTDQGFQDLALKEAKDKQSRFGVLSNVSQLMANEGDKVYQDKLRKYYDDLNYKRALEGASKQNQAAGWGGIDDTIQSAVSLIAPGGLLAGQGGQPGNNIPMLRNNGGQLSGTGARFPTATIPQNRTQLNY